MEAAEVLGPAGHAVSSRLLELTIRTMRAGLKLLRRLPDLSEDTQVQSTKALEALHFVADFAEAKLEDVIDLSANVEDLDVEDLDSVLRHPLVRHWTPAAILEVIAQIARRAGTQPEDLRLETVGHLRTMSEVGEAEARRIVAVHDRHRRLRLLPDAAELDKIMRDEAHLSGQWTKMLHEYEALQARGHGKHVPLARLDVQGLE